MTTPSLTNFRSGRRQRWCAAAATLPIALLAACSQETESKPAPTPPPRAEASKPKPPVTPEPPKPAEPADPAALTKRGMGVYNANCIACHNPDPALDGALGPAVTGSSYELIEARVLRAEYPEGYTPKRDSKLMVALPYISEDDLRALTAYLNP